MNKHMCLYNLCINIFDKVLVINIYDETNIIKHNNKNKL